jgi:hypothetical protein
MIDELLTIFAAMPGPPDDSDTLYARCYSRPITGPLPAGDPGDLAAANPTAEAIDDGWRIEQDAPDGCVIARKGGATRLFRAGQYLTLRGPGARVEADEPIRVIISPGAADIQPGFYHALGETISDYDEFEDLLRVYWNIAAEGAARLLAAVAREFNGFSIPFRFKCGQQPEIYERRDCAVLYVHRTYWGLASQLIARIHVEVAAWMRDGVPLFTQPLARGLAIAEDPGESFGRNRCAILSECMAATRGQPPAIRLADLRRRMPALETGDHTLNNLFFPGPAPDASATRSLALHVAARIGGRLCRDAIWSDALCNWTADRPEGNSASHAALIPQLYSGTAGVALALHHLAAATGEPIFARTARGAIDSALARMPVAGCGFYTGGSGVLYAAAEIRGEIDISAAIRQTESDRAALDVIAGSAGAIGALLHFHRRFGGDAVLEAAIRHGDLLIAEAARDDSGWSWITIPGVGAQTGFAHGAAGIAWALVELWSATGEERFRRAAFEAMRFERSCFDSERANWPDFRDAESRFDTVWCHGSGGIALSRLHIWRRTGDAQCLAEARIALASMRAALPTLQNFSLCHGTAGCADILIEAARILKEPEWLAGAEAAAQMGIERYFRTRRTWPGGMVRTVESPDLMWGLAGIAWFYLRVGGEMTPASPLLPCDSR